MLSLYGLTEQEIKELVTKLKAPVYRANQLLDWLYKKNCIEKYQISNLPKEFSTQLFEERNLTSLVLEKEISEESEGGGTKKFLFRTEDGYLLESVLIIQDKRRTVCISTQLGCKIKCPFCASGKGEFHRNLRAGEIIEQIAWIGNKKKETVTNVVFMGMGEPLDNLEEVLKAINILTAEWGFGMAGRRITVSTAGIVPKIAEFVKRTKGQIRLSVSLHSAKDDVRDKLVPINKSYPLRELKKTLSLIKQNLKKEITFEYALIKEINDSKEDAEKVLKLAKSLKAKINLIPCNPIDEKRYEAPESKKINEFKETLERGGLLVTLRKTTGGKVNAACGQLRLKK